MQYYVILQKYQLSNNPQCACQGETTSMGAYSERSQRDMVNHE